MSNKGKGTFRKRYKTIFTKAHELVEICEGDVRVYMVIERRSKAETYHYNSESTTGERGNQWPPNVDHHHGLGAGKLFSMAPADLAAREAMSRRSKTSSGQKADSPSDEEIEDSYSPSGLLEDFDEDHSFPELLPHPNSPPEFLTSSPMGAVETRETSSPASSTTSHLTARAPLSIFDNAVSNQGYRSEEDGTLGGLVATGPDDMLTIQPYDTMLRREGPTGDTSIDTLQATSVSHDARKRTATSPIQPSSDLLATLLHTDPGTWDAGHSSFQHKRPKSIVATRIVFPKPLVFLDSP